MNEGSRNLKRGLNDYKQEKKQGGCLKTQN